MLDCSTACAFIVAAARHMLETFETAMMCNTRHIALKCLHQVVLDDRRRLPGRFFGRFTTAIAAAL
jgi:hypothetical protein